MSRLFGNDHSTSLFGRSSTGDISALFVNYNAASGESREASGNINGSSFSSSGHQGGLFGNTTRRQGGRFGTTSGSGLFGPCMSEQVSISVSEYGLSANDLFQLGLKGISNGSCTEDLKLRIALHGVALHKREKQKVQRAERLQKLHQESCPICLESFANKTVAILPCGHPLCVGCAMQQAFSKAACSKKCPVCRGDICTNANDIETFHVPNVPRESDDL